MRGVTLDPTVALEAMLAPAFREARTRGPRRDGRRGRDDIGVDGIQGFPGGG
jgi:hypothetical protein